MIMSVGGDGVRAGNYIDLSGILGRMKQIQEEKDSIANKWLQNAPL